MNTNHMRYWHFLYCGALIVLSGFTFFLWKENQQAKQLIAIGKQMANENKRYLTYTDQFLSNELAMSLNSYLNPITMKVKSKLDSIRRIQDEVMKLVGHMENTSSEKAVPAELLKKIETLLLQRDSLMSENNASGDLSRKNKENRQLLRLLLELNASSRFDRPYTLALLKNALVIDGLDCQSHLSESFAICGNIKGEPQLIVLSDKGMYFEGDTIVLHLIMAEVFSYGNYVCNIDGKPVTSYNDGGATQRRFASKVGKQKVKAESIVTNPLTNETRTFVTDYEYEVFPKCSRDCNSIPEKTQ